MVVSSAHYTSASTDRCHVAFKIWLTIQCIYAYNFGASGNNLKKLYRATCQEAAVITWVQSLEEVPQQNLGGKKREKFAAISDNFRLWSQMFLERIDIRKI